MGWNDLTIGLKWLKWGREVLNTGTEIALNGGRNDQGPKRPKFFYPIELRLTKAASGCGYWHSLRSNPVITAPDINKADESVWEVERKNKMSKVSGICAKILETARRQWSCLPPIEWYHFHGENFDVSKIMRWKQCLVWTFGQPYVHWLVLGSPQRLVSTTACWWTPHPFS